MEVAQQTNCTTDSNDTNAKLSIEFHARIIAMEMAVDSILNEFNSIELI